MNNNAQRIREFVIEEFLFGDGAELHDDASFIETGIIDSTGVLELIMFLEDNFCIKVEPQDMIPENLDSVNKIDQFITRKLTGAEASDAVKQGGASHPNIAPGK